MRYLRNLLKLSVRGKNYIHLQNSLELKFKQKYLKCDNFHPYFLVVCPQYSIVLWILDIFPSKYFGLCWIVDNMLHDIAMFAVRTTIIISLAFLPPLSWCVASSLFGVKRYNKPFSPYCNHHLLECAQNNTNPTHINQSFLTGINCTNVTMTKQTKILCCFSNLESNH